MPVALRTLTLCALPGASALRHLSAAHLRDLGAAMLRQPRSPLLLDAVFDAVRMLYRMVCICSHSHPSHLTMADLPKGSQFVGPTKCWPVDSSCLASRHAVLCR